MLKHTGNLIVLKEQEGGELRITLTDAGREELKSYAYTTVAVSGYETMEFREARNTVWADLMEDIEANSCIREVAPEDIGALTDATIIADDVSYTEDGKLETTGAVWWFPNYMLENELETLLTKGEVTFTRAEEN